VPESAGFSGSLARIACPGCGVTEDWHDAIFQYLALLAKDRSYGVAFCQFCHTAIGFEVHDDGWTIKRFHKLSRPEETATPEKKDITLDDVGLTITEFLALIHDLQQHLDSLSTWVSRVSDYADELKTKYAE